MLINFNHIKTFYTALVQKMKGFRGNWEQNDDTADDYIKNRTHWSEGIKEVETVLVNNLTADVYSDNNPYKCNFVPGQSYDVTWNGTLYKNVVCRFEEGYNVLGGTNDYPFYIDDDGGDGLYVDDDNWTLSISIVEKKEIVHKLDKKFIDMPDNLVTEDDLSNVAFSGNYEDLYNTPSDTLNLSGITLPANFNSSSSVSCYGSGIYVSLSHRGAIYSTDGINWANANELPLSTYWKSVCYDDDRFIAVGSSNDDSLDQAIYSTDGINWNTLQLPCGGSWSSICYGNGIYVALRNSYQKFAAICSTDGINWIVSDLPATEKVTSVCYGNGRFVIMTDGTAIINSGSNKCYYSTTGTDWQTTTLPRQAGWTSVCYGNGMYVAVGTGQQNVIYSTDGITWYTATGLSSLAGLMQVKYGNGKFITIDHRGGIGYSVDGIAWNFIQLPGSSTGGLCYGNEKFILFCNNYVYYAEDGINWSNKSIFQLDQNVASETAAVIRPYLNIMQPDLSQNDPDAADYVKNRTHHMETSWNSVGRLAGTTFQEKADLGIRYAGRCSQGLTPIENARYRMTINETVLGPALYRVNNKFTDGYCLGNAYLYGLYTYGNSKTKEEIEAEGYVDTKEDFVYVNSSFVATTNPNVIAGEHVGVFTEMETVVVKPLDEKYIPNTIARKADIPQSDLSQSDPAAPDYVKNRTHYDDEIQIDTFVWDGNSEGRIVVPQGDSGIFYTKISDVMPTLDDCSKGGKVVRTYPDGRSVTGTIKTSTTGININGWLVIANSLVVVPEELVGVYFENDDCTFPESGLYGIGSDGVSPRYEISITGFTGFNERVLKKLDPKYLPDSIPYEETVFGDTLFWDGYADGRLVFEAPHLGQGGGFTKISNAAPTAADCSNGGYVKRIQADGGGTTSPVPIRADNVINMGGALVLGGVVFSIPEEVAGKRIADLDVVFPEPGLYAMGLGDGYYSVHEIVINGYSGFETAVVKKLDKKFLPDDVATKADIFGAMEASY